MKMPGKSKRLSKTNPAQAGFLKPTLASQRRCITSNSTDPNKSRRKGGKRPKVLNASNETFSKPMESSTGNGKCTGLLSAVEIYATKSSPRSLKGKSPKVSPRKEDSNTEHKGLVEARKMCEELREQIKELRSQQETYDQKMKILSLDPNLANSHALDAPYQMNSQSENLQNENMKLDDLEKSARLSAHPNSIIKVNVRHKPRPFQDASNSHSNFPDMYSSYSGSYQKSATPESIIKKLHSERDKYKRRVVKLQTELKLVKHNKEKVIKSPEIQPHELSFYNADMIGEGRLATVYAGTLNGKSVAVKKLIRSGLMTSSDRSYLTAEAGLLISLQHKNVVRVMGVCSTPMEPLIVTEFVNGRTVLDMLNKTGGGLDSATLFSVSRDVAIGMAYLHSQKPPVLHLNLRPSNVLVDAFLKAKVADFGFSKIRLDAGVSNCSYLAYLAPELLKFPAHLTVKTDVFAYAVLMWQMSTGRDPMAGRSTSQILDMIQSQERLNLPSHLPNALQLLITTCWDTSTIQRPTFKEIILELETMNLPSDWISKLKEIGITRTDTSDMGSTQDSNSVVSSAISVSASQQGHVPTSASVVDGKYSDSASTDLKSPPSDRSGLSNPFYYSRPTYTSVRLHADLRGQSSTPKVTAKPAVRSNSSQHSSMRVPSPCNELRYIPQNLHSRINKPEVVSTEKQHLQLLSDVDQLKPHLPASRHYASDFDASKYLERNDPGGKKMSRSEEAPSKFDDKFRDFVSDACQAESSSKVQATSLPSWRNVRLDPRNHKKTSVSSDYIRVRSLSTPSCSTTTSVGKTTSSVETAVYIPQKPTTWPEAYTAARDGADLDIKVSPLSYEHAAGESLIRRLVEDQIHAEYRKSSTVISNAKRLLSTSPLRNLDTTGYKPLTYQPSRYHPSSSYYSDDVKPLPEYKATKSDHRYSRSEPVVYQRSDSSKSSGSSESYLPLPPTLQSHHYSVLPLRYNGSKTTNGQRISDIKNSENNSVIKTPAEAKEDCENKDVDQTSDENCDKVSRLLDRTAGQLGDASDILYSAAAQRRNQKHGHMSGSI